MADGFVGLWPLVGAAQGDGSSVPGAATGGASVTGQDASEYIIGGYAFSPWAPVIGLVNSMGVYQSALVSASTVTGEAKAVIVKAAEASTQSTVTGQDASNASGFVGLFPFFGLQGSTPSVPWGGAYSVAAVTGEALLVGEMPVTLRVVFDIPPPADFKQPGLFLEYGLPTSLRAAGVASGDVSSVAYVTGDGRAVIVKTPEAAGTSQAAGQLRSAWVGTGEAASASRVTGVALGIITTTGTGASSGGATVEGVDRSLSPGAGLGHSTSASAIEGERRATNAQSGAAAARSEAGAVNVSGYPQSFTASSSSGGTVSGEAVATIIRTAQAEANAVLAGVQATIAIAEAAAMSYASVQGVTAALASVFPGGAWPRGKRGTTPRRPGMTNTRRPVNSS